ncbi:MAG: hypothetical protein HYS27_22775 [Deltaproteobacteria bacterium]|nr:hypothetical protein [Deltaproteobacteria bacterium]
MSGMSAISFLLPGRSAADLRIRSACERGGQVARAHAVTTSNTFRFPI